jgi:uncharacterized protein
MITTLSQTTYSVEDWIAPIEEAVRDALKAEGNNDGSHDYGHLYRVSQLGRRFAKEEGANELVVYVAGMLHELVNVPKNSNYRAKASFLSAGYAVNILYKLNFPAELIDDIFHAIHAHSFSAKVETKTNEANCVQDADRFEALGAFGLMRTMYVSGSVGKPIMDEKDPAAEFRALDDSKYGLDHFKQKLFLLEKDLKTEAGRKAAGDLTEFLRDFYDGIVKDQKEGKFDSGYFKVTKVFYKAGQKKMQLFHPDDPFAEKGRTVEGFTYALDNLFSRQDPYVLKFMDQLRFELNGY